MKIVYVRSAIQLPEQRWCSTEHQGSSTVEVVRNMKDITFTNRNKPSPSLQYEHADVRIFAQP